MLNYFRTCQEFFKTTSNAVIYVVNQSNLQKKELAPHNKNDYEMTSKTTIDRFKKHARLGTSLLISGGIISIPATMRGKRTSDDLAKSIYRFKDANPDYASSAIALIFSISESTLRGILKRRIVQKKSQIGSKICTHKKNQASAFGQR